MHIASGETVGVSLQPVDGRLSYVGVFVKISSLKSCCNYAPERVLGIVATTNGPQPSMKCKVDVGDVLSIDFFPFCLNDSVKKRAQAGLNASA